MLRRLLIAMSQPINLFIVGVIFATTIFTRNEWFLFGGMMAYMAFIVQRLRDEEFNKIINLEETYQIINKMDYKCERLAENAKNSTNSDKRFRVREVLRDKNDIVNSFKSDKENLLKQKIAKQTIELVTVYIKLIENYYIRLRDVENINNDELRLRIEKNTQKVADSDSFELKEDILNTIELDNKLLERITEEREELDRVSAKLTYIESSINLFKQQMMSSLEQEDVSHKVESVVNEAIALDNVLTQRRKERI